MANFFAVLDADPTRRAQCVAAVRPRLAPFEGLVDGECRTADLHLLWSADARAPLSRIEDEDGLAVLWGEAVTAAKGEQLDAAGLRTLWNDRPRRATPLNSYFAGLVYRPATGLVVGCDLLGTFPVYYYVGRDFLLVGSSPELFGEHPEVRLELDPVGLVGMLLTMHSFGGATLQRGVRRLAAGHHLIKPPDAAAREERHYRLPVSTASFSLPFSAQLEQLDHALDTWATRLSAADCSIFLSGGLDSRLLAGYLGRRGTLGPALTLGVAQDIEMQCAVKVARSLHLRHVPIELPDDDSPLHSERKLRWEHLANGFNSCLDWGLAPELRPHGARLVMGHMLDAVIGTRYINWAWDARTQSMSFDNFFVHANAWGLRPALLKQLLRKSEDAQLVDEVVARIRAEYESYSEYESQRAWSFNLHQRQRFHVGGSAWACAFGAWPVVPALDDGLLRCAGGMPASTIAERRAQIELLCTRFARLAALPLDRNSYDSRPLRPRLRYLLGQALLKPLRPMQCRRKGEKRYYVRTFDINNPAWRAVRRQAEAHRERLDDLFDREVFERLLPGPEADIRLENEIIDASGLKSLLGLMLWARNHL